MALVFKTDPDSPNRVEIVGVGTLFPNGKGGVPVADAAKVMVELQETDPKTGLPRVGDDGQPVPLSGSALTAAAKKWAADHGITTVDLTEKEIAALPQDAGLPADRPPLAEVGKQEYQRMYADVEAVNDDPEAIVRDNPPAAPAPGPSPSGGEQASGGSSGSGASGKTTTND